MAEKQEPTNWSELDPKNMKLAELKQELELRALSPKGEGVVGAGREELERDRSAGEGRGELERDGGFEVGREILCN